MTTPFQLIRKTLESGSYDAVYNLHLQLVKIGMSRRQTHLLLREESETVSMTLNRRAMVLRVLRQIESMILTPEDMPVAQESTPGAAAPDTRPPDEKPVVDLKSGPDAMSPARPIVDALRDNPWGNPPEQVTRERSDAEAATGGSENFRPDHFTLNQNPVVEPAPAVAPRATKMFLISEDDLQAMESLLPRIVDELIMVARQAPMPATRVNIRRVQSILTSVRWNYGPPTWMKRFTGGQADSEE